MKYIVNIDNPTPDVLRQIWFAAMQQKENITGALPAPTSTDGGDMKIFISVADAEPNLIAGIGKVMALIDSAKPAKTVAVHQAEEEKEPQAKSAKKIAKWKWGRIAKRNLNMRSPDAPYGLRKDGKPRKPSGRTAQSLKKTGSMF